MNPFTYRDLTVQQGAIESIRLPIGQLASGYPLSLPLHVAHGTRPGPTLLLLGVIHGDEIFAIDVIRRALHKLDVDTLRGTVLAVPVCNPAALAAQTRNTPLDMLNLNRLFPGKSDGWLSERMAAELRQLVDRSDCLIHLDGGSAERIIHYVFVKGGDNARARDIERLSKVFGLKMLYRGPQVPGSVTSYAAENGIPCVLAEIGGAMLYTDPVYLRRAVQGVTNVMRELGMIDGEVALPPEQFLLTKRVLVRVPEGGIFHPSVGLEVIDQPVSKGTVLGILIDPYSLKEITSITAPYDQSIIFQMRVLPTAVQPGDYAYIIGDYDSAEQL